ncbi:YegS/Rv2252/BmrU family lipid kinase [Nocardia sp. CDC159]|uniref:YegS/Rv2252/BmrU family lipid kinase n=1 Tax=Nocardia pulmonis TaxID=2951408 RepID=A0A9X2EBF7_9NOCA|nr:MULTISPECIES: YegS/Rv2252/BmrU family lipid kinase [Nocardia]MCM6777632.1 YegS/Rv2252/BmrU family lipid kinase [Nocardia pulmonis]MCM6790564.1 YegS/Rv2252/BmrU family lipid kinase [Nocardia sp. CDC159]
MSGQIRSVLLVTNPLSGHGRGVAAAATARARFAERGVRVVDACGETVAETIRLVRDSLADHTDGPDAVVCAGGDGLVCIVLQALAGTGVPLGMIPGGTGNDLARELGVPEGDPLAAAEVVLAGNTRTIDLGVVRTAGPHFGGAGLPESVHFATVVGTGLDARVTLRANRMRYPKGPLRYTLAALAELASGLAVPYRLDLRGVPGESGPVTVETEAIMVAVGNTRSYGGGMQICPDAVIDDGLLEVTVVGAMSRLEMLRLLPVLSSGKRVDHPALRQFRATGIDLAAPGAPATADGEPAGLLPANFRVLPGAQPVLVP